MISIILKNRNIAGENYKKALIFYDTISTIHHLQTPRIGATRSQIYIHLKKKHIYISLEEISRFLQYMKENKLIKNIDNDYWVTIV